ncbi:alpha,alpha-trehalase [Arcicella aurantiaca]|uniref:Alpha,alpha-trehalase n=1 Tax=Arcicella aurantiaca TaxID=591202 RepID=A0A316EC89_9BACT|nr:alpha,alpha-trehalase TreF [Arcicella aurantiaca]PWK26393.1 alpha,alpha-trehalase [Arcicella aurantiaca]
MLQLLEDTYPFASTEVFKAVQMSSIFPDSKTFTDYIPKYGIEVIEMKFLSQQKESDFNLAQFITENFDKNPFESLEYHSDTSKPIAEHLDGLWNVLTREPAEAQGSLIALPHAYIVPGGRFQEIYYWDSYFSILGLQTSRRVDLIENIVNNFAHLINQIGYIPNGNRAYFLGRSQPPFFSLMVEVLREEKGDEILAKYLPVLEKEYDFWMSGKNTLSLQNRANNRVVLLGDGVVLNRFWDEYDTPRPESYREDVELAESLPEHSDGFYRHIRAAAESGWDFSSRWFKDCQNMNTIHTTDILPVDLNCLLLNLEKTLTKAHSLAGNLEQSENYANLANQREAAINTYFYNAQKGFYFDYDFVSQAQTNCYTLAGAFPLFFKISKQEQVGSIEYILRTDFLKDGGVITTLNGTGQQWDSPNGWAPLQYMTYKGLVNYGFLDLANEIKNRWMNTNEKVYQQTGKMTEKYNVKTPDTLAGGGEYPNQDGFGWTNGVYLKFLRG